MSAGEWPDLRLIGFACGIWLSAIAALYSPAASGFVLAGGAVVTALVVTAATAIGGSARVRLLREPVVRDALRWAVLAVLVGGACGATVTAIRVTAAHAQPVAGLARARATVTASLVVSTDPHPVGQARLGPPTYGFEASLVEVDTPRVGTARVGTARVGTAGVGTARPETRLSMRVFVLASGDGWLGLLPGQRLRVTGRLAPPDLGGLDAALFDVSEAPVLSGRPPWTQRAAGSLRAGLQTACAGLPAQVRGLLPGLIDGDTTRLDPSLSSAFRATGMTHLLAVSGSNVAMIIGAVLLVARWSRRGPSATALLCTFALLGFVVLVRPSPSVLRAAAMGALGLVALATGRNRAALPGLAASVAALILYDPQLATDIGFSLSVFATGGLLLIAPHWRDALRARRVPAGLADAVAVPAAAQVACAPLIAGFTGTVSIVAVPANLLAVPAVPAATVLGVGAAVMSPVWPGGAAFLAWLASWPARWLIFVAERGAAAPASVAAWPAGVWGGLLLAAISGGALVALRHRTSRLVAVVAVVAVFVGVAPVRLVTGGWPPTGALLVACDVGQGDGLVLPLGAGRGIVVDSGPEPTAIDSCLRRLGVTDVSLLVLTHFHADHVGGIDGVFDGRRVEAILTSPFPQPPEGYREVVTAAATHRVPMSAPVLGEVFVIGSARLTVLGPVARLVGTRSDPNNNSLVIRVDEAGVRILLTGDAEIEEQIEVLATDGAGALRADVLKVPHHGSAYQSPAFLAAVAPTVALVSVGAINPYGLPSAVTINRVSSGGARVMRTDIDGDIAAVTVDGRLAVAARGHPAGTPVH